MRKRTKLLGYAVPVLCLWTTMAAHAQDAPPATDAPAFLKWSMAHYAALKTFQADATWAETFGGSAGGGGTETKRTLAYASPNRFKITNTTYGRLVFRYICDGKRMVIIKQGFNQPPERFLAPASLADATDNNMSMPDFGGSSLYRFFAGPDGYTRLLDEDSARRVRHRTPTPVRFGPDVTVDGEPCRTVVFGGGLFHDETRAAISSRDGLVRRLQYFSARKQIAPEQIAQTKQAMAEYLASAEGKKLPAAQRTLFAAQIKTPTKFLPAATTTEVYTHLVTGGDIPDATFDTTLPGGVVFAEVGQTVPEAAVKPLAGGPAVSLSSLRGQVVLIDFWATWCPPCRKGLPETLALHRELAAKGLTVLAVTDEAAPTVTAFVQKNGYGGLPVFRDPGGALNKLFGVTAIPTVAVIDANGTLVAEFVGLQTPETLRAALTKAGLTP